MAFTRGSHALLVETFANGIKMKRSIFFGDDQGIWMKSSKKKLTDQRSVSDNKEAWLPFCPSNVRKSSDREL